jgi:CRP-like cAMP-binding protein
MAVDALSEEGLIIRQLIPLANMPGKWFNALCEQLVVEEAEDGKFLFYRGDANTELFYLLKGSVSLQIDELKIETITAGSDAARFSLAHQVPRKVNVIAKGNIRYLRLRPEMMKFAPDTSKDDRERDMTNIQLTESDDWMTTLLMSPIFRALPPANLQKVIMALEEVNYKAGDVIIEQGEEGDYFYFVKKGQCQITRKPFVGSKEIKLATCNNQDAFGEDALISGLPRNAAVSAITDVSLLRLNKDKFISLIKHPLLKHISYHDAAELLAKGAMLIDVREPEEYNKYHLPRSVNIPLFSLRMQLRTMNRQQLLILVCKDGVISETAAFILIRHKFSAYVLLGGIDKLGADLLKSTATAFQEEVVADGKTQAQVLSTPVENETELLRDHLRKMQAQYKVLQTEKTALEEKCASLTKHVNVLLEQLKAVKSKTG